ncbi:MAG TPA: hypothetical protein VFW05_04665 [Verrucomicrobiae bacterium]|jgi:hypothetical protein|nr:hypothetical protein [Verrucomicrobiae bacterium]
MESPEHQRLIEKLRRIESLFADRAATPGEKAAAGEAADRIRQRLNHSAETDPPVEFSFALRNPWSHRLFVALCRRYNLRPYRYARQRRTTVMVRVPKRFVHLTLWPEFQELDRTLQSYLTDITQRVIAESINKDISDIEVRSGNALPECASEFADQSNSGMGAEDS